MKRRVEFDPRGVLQTISYKPGWSFSVEPMSFEEGSYGGYHGEVGWRLRITTAPVPDATAGMIGRQTMPISITEEIPPYFADLSGDMRETFVNWVWHQCLAVERHESTEWFRVSGKHLINPHP